MSRDNELQTRGGIDSLITGNEYNEPEEVAEIESEESMTDRILNEEPIPEEVEIPEPEPEKKKMSFKAKNRLCSAACIAAGILGTGLIGAGTLATCGLYDFSVMAFATQVPNGTDIDGVYVGPDGKVHINMQPSETTTSDTTSTPEDSTPDETNKPNDIPPVTSEDTNSTPEDTKPADTKPEETGKPVENIPGTGEEPLERVTDLMEIALLKAKDDRIANNENAYLDTDICITVSDSLSFEDISAISGFSVSFISEYNNVTDITDVDVIRLPKI